MKFKKFLFSHVFTAFFFLLLCSISCNKYPKLERTKTDQWERRSYPKLGISIEMPKDVRVLRVICRNPNDLDFGFNNLLFFMHPEYYGYVEPHYVLDFDIFILNKKQYESYTLRKNGILSFLILKDTTFLYELKENFRRDDTSLGKYYYRRDYRNDETGDVVLATATYWESIDPNHKQEDVSTIRRVLNSIQFIPKELSKEDK